jgi:hypothetical protein
MTVHIDRSGTAARPDGASLSDWASKQRVFISSVMNEEMTPLRQEVAKVIAELGAEPVWFEKFGGRDDDAEMAYLGEVDSSTLYVGLLGSAYGRLDRTTRRSATHVEYLRAEEVNLPVSVWIRADGQVDGNQLSFINDVRVFHTTGSFSDPDDLADGIRTRLTAMAGAELSPWVKVGSSIFRARDITDDGTRLTINASVHDPDVLADLEQMRPNSNWGRTNTRLTHSGRSWPVRVRQLTQQTTAARSTGIVLELERLNNTGSSLPMSVSMGIRTYTPDDLAKRDLRSILFGQEPDDRVLSMGGSIRNFVSELPTAPLPHEVWAAAFTLLFTEALIESGRALRVRRVQVSPPGPKGRRVELDWEGHSSRGQRGDTCHLSGMLPYA